ncbi:uncharacterized protein [Clytia hemisphaerica]|uniref:LicD/FKTN/FKRP nucleotidyltransferase domain-containing protein n=1 Tax=Clytia hemisphaerica TaxID=252671 RepID=A0A7M5X7S3_9CNID
MATQMTQGVILLLVCFTLANVYYFIQNYSQNTYFQEVRRTLTIVKNKEENVDVTNTAKSSSGGLTQVNEILKRLQTLETKRNVDMANKTKTVLDGLIGKFWPNGQQASVVDEAENLKWLNRTNAKGFAEYGDGTCPVTTDRPPWQKLLREWVKIAKKHKIRYFLSAGSLLGAWRAEDVIPYDADMDIRIHIDDFEKLYPLRQRKFVWDAYDDYESHFYFTKDWRLPYDLRRRYTCKGKKVHEYEGQCSFTDPNARMIYRQWHMDLYAYTTYTDVVKFLPRDAAYEYRKEDILPITKCMFMEIETRCPQNPTAIFKRLYGSSRPLPTKKCVNKKYVRV